jgi:nitrogen fixation/metabolism regulation signal transduction histidine kinase
MHSGSSSVYLSPMPDSRRKQPYLLDPRFQLKWTGYLVVVVVLVMTALGVVIARTANRASDTATLAVKQAEKAFEESRTNNILARRTVQLAAADNAALTAIMDESLGDVDAQSEKNLADVKRRQAEIASDRQRLQLLLIGSGVALLALLTLMGVVITHRIVGPVHRMKRLLRRVSTGRLVIEERLRKGDELEDLFDTFLQMTYSLRAMQTARLRTLDGAIRHAETTAAPEEVLDGMRALRAQMVLGLEPRRASLRPPAPSATT